MIAYEIAAKMIDCEPDELDIALKSRLDRVEYFIGEGNEYDAHLISTQTIATIIMQWEEDTRTNQYFLKIIDRT